MDCFIGRKGSGKSYNVVATVILPALRSGRNVVTNIPFTDLINTDETIKGSLYSFDIDNLDPDFFAPVNIKKGAIYVLDEVQKLWGAGMQVVQFSRDEKRFISESRHMVGDDGYTTDIVLVTQDTELLARYPRNLVDKTYRCKKLDLVGLSKSYKVDVFDGPVSLNLNSKAVLINSFTGKYNKEVFSFYCSHTLNDSVYSSGLESKNKNASVLSSKLIKFGLPLSIVFIIFSFYYIFSYFSNFGGSSVKSPVSVPVPVSSSVPVLNEVPNVVGSIVNKSSLVYDFSSVYRISYYLPLFKAVYITDNFSFFPIPFSSCKFVPVVGLNCLYGNEIVNYYSGALPSYEKNDSSISLN